MFSVFQKKTDQNGDLQVLQLYRDPKAFSLKNLVYSTEEEWQSLVPPPCGSGGSVVVDVPNPDVLVSVRSTLKLHGCLGEKYGTKNEARRISPTWDFMLKMYMYTCFYKYI